MSALITQAASRPEAQDCRPGADMAALSDPALLAILLESALGQQEAGDVAHRALRSRGSLRALFHAALHRDGELDTDLARLLRCAHELVGRQLGEELQRGTALTSPTETLDYLRHHLGQRRREVFQCLFLDTRHRVIHSEALFQGSIDGACVYPRVIAERALRHNAAAVIVAHNHPSGVTEPSLADQAITRRLKDALALFEIRLLDHFVIGEGEPVSMAARGML